MERVKQAATRLLHVLCDGVLLQELGALPGVEALRVGQELALKVLLVHGQRGALGERVVLLQTQLNYGSGRGRGNRGETWSVIESIILSFFWISQGVALSIQSERARF